MRPRGKQLSRHRFCQQRPNLGSKGFCLGERRKEFKKMGCGEVVDNSRYLVFLGGWSVLLVLKINTSLWLGWFVLRGFGQKKRQPSVCILKSFHSSRKRKASNFGGGVQQKLFWGVSEWVQHVMEYTDWFRRLPNFSSFSGFLPNTPNGQRSPNLDN